MFGCLASIARSRSGSIGSKTGSKSEVLSITGPFQFRATDPCQSSPNIRSLASLTEDRRWWLGSEDRFAGTDRRVAGGPADQLLGVHAAGGGDAAGGSAGQFGDRQRLGGTREDEVAEAP